MLCMSRCGIAYGAAYLQLTLGLCQAASGTVLMWEENMELVAIPGMWTAATSVGVGCLLSLLLEFNNLHKNQMESGQENVVRSLLVSSGIINCATLFILALGDGGHWLLSGEKKNAFQPQDPMFSYAFLVLFLCCLSLLLTSVLGVSILGHPCENKTPESVKKIGLQETAAIKEGPKEHAILDSFIDDASWGTTWDDSSSEESISIRPRSFSTPICSIVKSHLDSGMHPEQRLVRSQGCDNLHGLRDSRPTSEVSVVAIVHAESHGLEREREAPRSMVKLDDSEKEELESHGKVAASLDKIGHSPKKPRRLSFNLPSDSGSAESKDSAGRRPQNASTSEATSSGYFSTPETITEEDEICSSSSSPVPHRENLPEGRTVMLQDRRPLRKKTAERLYWMEIHDEESLVDLGHLELMARQQRTRAMHRYLTRKASGVA